MGQIKKVLENNIRNLRTAKGWTQGYLADVLELTPSFLTLVESGQRGMSLEVIEKIADGERIGSCCAFPNDDGSIIDVGYCINKKFWRNGYASEAVDKLPCYYVSLFWKIS